MALLISLLWTECDDPSACSSAQMEKVRFFWTPSIDTFDSSCTYYALRYPMTPLSNATAFVKTIKTWSLQCSFEGNWRKVDRKGRFIHRILDAVTNIQWNQSKHFSEFNQNIYAFESQAYLDKTRKTKAVVSTGCSN